MIYSSVSVDELSYSLKALIAQGSRSRSFEFERPRIDAIIERLTSIGPLEDAREISNGRWQVIYSSAGMPGDRLPLWESLPPVVRFFPLFKNLLWHDYDLDSGLFEKVAQIAGSSVSVLLQGHVACEQPSSVATEHTAKRYRAEITHAYLSLFGSRVTLPVQGQGTITLLYQDRILRILGLPGSSQSWSGEGEVEDTLIIVQMPLDRM